MKLDTIEVRDGEHNGKEVWICDYRWNDFDIKQTRNIRPTKVLIRAKEETNKTVYYSNAFFSEIQKDKVVNSSLIKLYDNTGYRSYAGVALHVFTEEEECRKFYKKQAKDVFKEFVKYRDGKLSRLDSISNEILLLV